MQKTILPGLVSVTFRQFPPERIIELVAEAGLRGIEWGGDVHVPHGDLATARRVQQATRDAGLAVAAYGSYYRAGQTEDRGVPFAAVLDTAQALQAPVIRVWAGSKGSAETPADDRQRIAEDLHRAGSQAQEHGFRISIEFHANSLTDSPASALQLMQEIDHPNVFLYWQPPVGGSVAENVHGLQQILPYLSHVHVFHWHLVDDGIDCRPLAEGEADWQAYFSVLAEAPGERFALLEFVRDDDEQQFLQDAAMLRRWLEAFRG